MALMSTAVGSEVGLRLLLSPAASHAILRTACTVVCIGFPVYSTHKAIEQKNHAEQEQWLVYWAAYGCFSVVEFFSDKVLSWFPFYYHAKFAFLIWLQLPRNYVSFLSLVAASGAWYLYTKFIRPLLLKHQARLDRIVDGTRNELNNFILSHQREVLAIKHIVQKCATLVYQAAQDALQNTTRAVEGSNLLGGPTSQDDISSPSADDSAVLDENPDDAGWIYTDRPPPSD